MDIHKKLFSVQVVQNKESKLFFLQLSRIGLRYVSSANKKGCERLTVGYVWKEYSYNIPGGSADEIISNLTPSTLFDQFLKSLPTWTVVLLVLLTVLLNTSGADIFRRDPAEEKKINATASHCTIEPDLFKVYQQELASGMYEL